MRWLLLLGLLAILAMQRADAGMIIGGSSSGSTCAPFEDFGTPPYQIFATPPYQTGC